MPATVPNVRDYPTAHAAREAGADACRALLDEIRAALDSTENPYARPNPNWTAASESVRLAMELAEIRDRVCRLGEYAPETKKGS